jgi:4,4'-diaponeurosporenoate glycosyltransferase
MSLAVTVVSAVLGAAIAGCSVLGVVLWHRQWAALRRGAAPGAPPAAPPPTLSVIVPARNEARNLPSLLASLTAMEPPLHQIIVVDDHSSDATAAIARAAGAIVVSPAALPAGWVGKAWACQAGAAQASGEWLLFTDADTVHAPWSARVGLATAIARDAQLLSIVPSHAVVSFWERLQGAFHLLLLLACDAGTTGSDAGERRFSIGQYLLISAAAYRAIDGHAGNKDRLAEDLAMARAVVDSGRRFTLLYAPSMMTVRMYPEGLRSFLRGWRRSFREGLSSAGRGGVLDVVVVIGWWLGLPLGVALAALHGPSLLLAIAAVAYLATALHIASASRGLGAFPAWAALAFPLPVLAFVVVSALAALDHARGIPVTWRGRQIEVAASAARRQR